MRPLWKGAISFGLVNIPVKLYKATENSDIKFNYLHAKCRTPIQYRKYCPYCRVEVAAEEIVRGYEYEKGHYVILQEEDLEGIPRETTRSIGILDFVDLEEIDPVYFDRAYYLGPAEMGHKAYALLRRALETTGKIAIARVSLRTRESLAAVRVFGEALVLNTMFYPREVRKAADLPELNFEADLHENELKMAVTLVNNLAARFEPDKYTDTYRQALMELIEARVSGAGVAVPAVQPQAGKVVDLMEALKASIELAKKEKGLTPDGEEGKKTRRRRKTS